MRLILLIVFLFLAKLSNSQSYYFENYSVNDGLAQSTSYGILQDSAGYLWIGTASGLSKFDGTEFYNYTSANGLSGNGIRAITQDKYGVIWLGHTGGGISIYNGDDFLQLNIDSTINSNISAIEKDKFGNIWISTTGNGVFQIMDSPNRDFSNMEIVHYTGKDGLSDRVFDIYISRKGDIYFITDAGLKRYNSDSSIFESYIPEGLPSYFQITTMFIDNEDNAWFGTYNGGLYKKTFGKNGISLFDVKDGLAHNWISKINQDRTGAVWVGTWGGGISRIFENNIFTFNLNNGLHDIKIWDIINDREGNVIIGTNENGIDVFKGDHFITYLEKSGLSNNQVWSIVQDDKKRFWFGTNSGITIFKNEVKDSPNNEELFEYINEENDHLISNEVRFLKKDRQGRMWIGTSSGIVYTASSTDIHHFVYPPRLNGNISLNVIMGMDIDDDNNLWVGTLDGVIYYEIDNNALNQITQRNGLLGNEISEVFCDSDGDIWVGCAGKGLNVISGTEFKIIDLGGDYTPNVINEDKEGNIWIGTDGQGIIVFHKENGIVATYSTENGLHTNLISSIEIDNENNIWIGTNKGLNKIDHDNNKVTTYSENDGFIGIENKQRSSYRDDNENLWFGTVEGVTKYRPDRDFISTVKPLIQITNLKVNLNDWNLKNESNFTYKEKSFNFTFKGIFFTNPNAVRYKTMLLGIDNDWSSSTELTFVNYPALPPGKYTFSVKASSANGEWTEASKYSFTIRPPFWQTWWFYLICVAFIISSIYYFIKMRERQLIQEKKILEDKVVERTAEVVQKNEELATINEDITSSIRYAQRIQQAIFPPDALIKRYIPESFVFFRPKDIVSGDFYWVSELNGTVMFSAIDCTGHGVPGAFMSIIGYNSLDKIVNESKITEPAEILNKLNKSVSEILRQKGNDNGVKDGMDIALVSIDYNKKKIEYAGAFNPFYLFRDGKLIETKANKFAIGSFNNGSNREFVNHEFDLKKGDVIYLFSDGYPDQFGGPKGKKYMHKPFKEFLRSIHTRPIDEQHQLLEIEFLNWLGSYEQTDDVIVMGVKV